MNKKLSKKKTKLFRKSYLSFTLQYDDINNHVKFNFQAVLLGMPKQRIYNLNFRDVDRSPYESLWISGPYKNIPYRTLFKSFWSPRVKNTTEL